MSRRDSLRRQLQLLHEIRDRVEREPEDDYEEWAVALTALTDRIIRELMALEGTPLHSPPYGSRPEWYVAVVAVDSDARGEAIMEMGGMA